MRLLDDRLREFSRYSELKQLACNIAALQQEKLFRSLTVLSFLPGEGKTLFCAALALAYVDTCHSQALLVDTTTSQNKRSLALKECFDASTPLVEVASLDELRAAPASTTIENDFSLIKRVAEDRSKSYGLVLFDTAPLQARNRSNVDPLLVARLSGASAVVVGRKFLDAPNLSASLKVLQDPTLHLLGIISNEKYRP